MYKQQQQDFGYVGLNLEQKKQPNVHRGWGLIQSVDVEQIQRQGGLNGNQDTPAQFSTLIDIRFPLGWKPIEN